MKKFKTYKLMRESAYCSIQIKVGEGYRFATFTSVGYGTNVASGNPRYSTSDEAMQCAIEDSPAFKDGKIVLERTVECSDDSHQSEEMLSGKSGAKVNIPEEGVNKGSKAPGKEKAEDSEKLPAETGLQEVEQAEGSVPEEGVNEGSKAPEEEKAEDSEKLPAETGSTGGEQTEYPEVTEFTKAREILRGEPYKVAYQSLNSPENILKKAGEVGVSFPNLKIGE